MKKLSAFLATLAMVVSIAPRAEAATFTDQGDIPSWASEYISELVADGVIKGYADGRFGPNDALTRAQFAKIAVLAAGVPSDASVSTSGFADVPAAHWAAPFVKAAKDNGIIGGYANGNFGPDDQVTRAQAAKILANAFGLAEQTSHGPTFSDVTTSTWYYPFVETAYYYSVIGGYADGRFGPNDPVTRAQVAKMAVLAKSPTVRSEFQTAQSGNEVPAGELGISSAEAKSSTSIMVTFSKAVQTATSENIANYSVEGLEVKSARRASDGMSVTLTTSNQVSGKDYSLMVSNVKSSDGTMTLSGSADSVVFVGYVTTVSSTPFTVAVSPNTPRTASIPKNANAIPFVTWDFTAGSQEDVKISKIIVERTGLGSDDDFSGLYLYEGVTRLTDDRTLNNDTHTATFNLTRPIVVPAGQTRSITLTGTFTSGLSGNTSYAFQLTFAEDVTAVGSDTGGAVNVSGDFPLRGETMTVANLTAGELIISAGTASDSEVKVGEIQADFGQLKLQAGSVEDVLVTQVTIENKGNSSDDLENITIYRDDTGEMLASVPVLDNDRAVFDLSNYGDGGLLVNDGETMRINVKADVVTANSNSDQIDFEIDDVQDIVAIGQTYGYGVAVYTDTTGTQSFSFDFSDSGSNGYVSIKSSEITFDFQKPENTEVSSDSTERVVGIVDITNRGEELLIKNFNLDVLYNASTAAGTGDTVTSTTGTGADYIFANSLDNVKLVDSNGNVVAGPRDAAHNGTRWMVSFTDNWVVPSSASAQRYYLKADIKNTAVNGVNFGFGFVATNTTYLEVEGNVTGNSVATADLAPSSWTPSDNMQIQDAVLTIARASTPTSDVRIAGNTVDSLGVILQANDTGDVEVRKMVFNLADATSVGAGTAISSSEIVTASLYTEDGTFLDSATISSGKATFDSFQNDLIVPSGGQVKVIVKTALNSGVTNGDILAYNILSTSNYITAVDAEGNTLDDGTGDADQLRGADTALNSVTGITTNEFGPTGTPNSARGIYTIVKTSGSLAVQKSDAPIVAKQLQLGASNVDVMKLKLQATDEDIYLKKLRLWVVGNNGSGSVAANDLIKTLSLYDGSTLVGSAQNLRNTTEAQATTGAYAEWNWTGTSRPMIAEGTKELTVKATFNTSDNDVATPGTPFRIFLATGAIAGVDSLYDIEAEGSKNDLTVGDTLTITANNSSLSIGTTGNNGDSGLYSQAMTPYDTLLTVSKATQEVYGRVSAPTGTENYFKFTVAASARPASDTSTQQIQAVLKQIRMKVTGTVTAANFTLYNAADGQPVDGLTVNGTAHPASGSTEVVFDLTTATAVEDYKLNAGGSNTYFVRADVDSTGAASDTTKTLAFSFATFGSKDSTASSSPSYVVWQDTNQNGTDSANVYWIDQADTSLSSGTVEFTSVADNVASGDSNPNLAVISAYATSATEIVVYLNHSATTNLDGTVAALGDVDALRVTTGATTDGASVAEGNVALAHSTSSANKLVLTLSGGMQLTSSDTVKVWTGASPAGVYAAGLSGVSGTGWLASDSATVDVSAL